MMVHAGCVTIGMVLYLRWLGEWHWKPDWAFLTPKLRKELVAFISFSGIGWFRIAGGGQIRCLYARIHRVSESGRFILQLQPHWLPLLSCPSRKPVFSQSFCVAKYLADNNMKELDKLYKSVSINLLVAGLLLFHGMGIHRKHLSFLPQKPIQRNGSGHLGFLFYRTSRLVEMSTGLNNNMIYYSPHYRYSLISLGISAGTNGCPECSPHTKNRFGWRRHCHADLRQLLQWLQCLAGLDQENSGFSLYRETLWAIGLALAAFFGDQFHPPHWH